MEEVNYINSKRKALAIAKAASDKKALDIVTIDMRKIPTISDYFVIASGTSTTHANAIADNIVNELKLGGERLRHSEGEREALWILLDYGDVVAHVFYDETRRFYNLERLWRQAPQERFEEPRMKKVSVRPAKKKKKAAHRPYALRRR